MKSKQKKHLPVNNRPICLRCDCPRCGTRHECKKCEWVCHYCGNAECDADGLMPVDVLVQTRILTNNNGGMQQDTPNIEVRAVETEIGVNFCADGDCYDKTGAREYLGAIARRFLPEVTADE